MALRIGSRAARAASSGLVIRLEKAVDSSVCRILSRILQPNDPGYKMPFGLDAFKRSRLGQRISAVIEDPRNVDDMIVFSRHGMPAVQAVGKDLLALGPEVRDDRVKK